MENTLLNLIPSSYIPEVHLSQYDIGRTIQFKLMDGNSEYSVPSGATVKILATKPSGLGFEVACTFSGNVVTLVNTETMSNESGRFRAELRITSGATILGTSNFIMNVERSPHPEGTIDGDAETLLPELTLLVERIEDSNARIESMTATATPLPSGQNPTATYDSTNNNLDLGIPVADRQYITVDGVDYAITSITKVVRDEIEGIEVEYGSGQTIFIFDSVGMNAVATMIQAQLDGKVSAVKLNGDILTPHYDSSFGDGVVDLGTISDDTKADAIVKTASGSIASFSDGGDDMPMKSLKVNIVPKQDGSGDPSPSNVRAISGWDSVDVTRAGGSLLKVTHESGDVTTGGITYNIDGGRVTVNGTSTSYYPTEILGTFGLKKGTYTLKKKITGNVPSGAFLYIILENTGLVSDPATRGTDSRTFTLDEDRDGIRAVICAEVSGKTWNNVQIENWLESADAPLTDYEPYDGETITTNLPQTVYGGTLDVVSGNGDNTLRHIIVPNDTPVNLRSSGDGIKRYVASISELRTGQYKAMENNAGVLMASKLSKGNGYSGTSPYLAFLDVGNLYFTVPDTMTDADASSLVRGMELLYELETPTEITLTPTEVKSLLGANNVWSESGTVEVEYRADTTLAYNELLNLIANM